MDDFYLYALVSLIDGRIYVGIAHDPEKRLIEHNSGKTKSTKGFVPWKLFYTEFCGIAAIARSREIYFKSSAGKRRLRAILNSLS